jgi:hypothetical protein
MEIGHPGQFPYDPGGTGFTTVNTSKKYRQETADATSLIENAFKVAEKSRYDDMTSNNKDDEYTDTSESQFPDDPEGTRLKPVRSRKKPRQQSADATTWNKDAAETVEKSTSDDTMINDNDHHLQLATELHVFNSKQSQTTKTHTRVKLRRLTLESRLSSSHQSHNYLTSPESQLFDSHQSHNSSTRTRVTTLRLAPESQLFNSHQSHTTTTHTRVTCSRLATKSHAFNSQQSCTSRTHTKATIQDALGTTTTV